MKPQMVQSTYDRLAVSDGDSSQNYYRHAGPDMRLKSLLPLCKKTAPRRILEIGCGDGHVMGSLKGFLEGTPEAGFFGLDVAEVSLQRAKDKGFGNVVQASAEKLPFARNSFELVIASQVLEHIPDLEGAIDQAFSALRPGGTFVITVPLADWFKLYKGLAKGAPVKFLDQETHIREWSLLPFQGFVSKDGLLDSIRKRGFTVRCCRGVFFFVWRLERMADLVRLRFPPAYDLLRAWDVILGSVPVFLWTARYAIIVSQKPE